MRTYICIREKWFRILIFFGENNIVNIMNFLDIENSILFTGYYCKWKCISKG